jgi:acyl-coenzyme A synthetase/AMP-(fatty) acid ligase
VTDARPLLANYHPNAVLAWRADGPVTQGQFLAEALALAQHLPPNADAINLCEDRYRFMLAFCAVCLRGRANLLPPSKAPAVIEALLGEDVTRYVLDDAMATAQATAIPAQVPQIESAQIAAIVSTSGSTGAPQRHTKSWGVLCDTARLARDVFLPDDNHINIIATVPPQHMYGLETSVFFALAANCAVHHGKPFFPADVRDALAAIPAPRLLITTPVHLRALIAAAIPFPQLTKIISATAPLTRELATLAEQHFNAPVHEIYGCTEAGSMASRRTATQDIWQLHPGMSIRADREGAQIRGKHLPDIVAVNDDVEIADPAHFHLLGRHADLLKVAGKRASLSDLTQKLLSISGVEDAALLVPDGAERPAALVVAPQGSEGAILAELAQHVDAVFLPRPLRLVERLPRNELGKLSRDSLLELLS